MLRNHRKSELRRRKRLGIGEPTKWSNSYDYDYFCRDFDARRLTDVTKWPLITSSSDYGSRDSVCSAGYQHHIDRADIRAILHWNIIHVDFSRSNSFISIFVNVLGLPQIQRGAGTHHLFDSLFITQKYMQIKKKIVSRTNLETGCHQKLSS